MTSATLRVHTAPAAEPAAPDAATAYAERIANRLATTLIAELADLTEPAAPSRDRALAILGRLVDTLSGYALGGGLAPVLACVQAATLRPVDRAVIRRALVYAARTADPVKRTGLPAIVRSVIADAEQRPLVDELGTRLHQRLLADTPRLAAAVAAILAAVPAEHAVAIAAALRRRTDDDLDALRFSEQLVHGWQTYAAAIGAGAMPAIDHDRSRTLWREWLRRIRRERRIMFEPSATALGYIMRVE